jgi:DNA-binding transcriptional MerR regulator
MTTNRQEPGESRAGVSVSEMARMVGLSRQRFRQLVQAGVFPQPKRDEASGRPYYDGPAQQQCLEVRRRNRGVNGQVVLFYARRHPAPPARPKAAKPKLEVQGKDVAALVDGLNALGLTTATAAQVQRVTEELFPKGTAGIDQGEVLRAVFLHLKRQNTAEQVGRE